MRRRDLIMIAPALLAAPAWAGDVLRDYERRTGGRVGVYAENTATGARLAYRADERFVMCSSFKASLAACVLARADRGQDDLRRMIGFGPADMQDWWAPVAKQNMAKGALSVADMCAAAVEWSDNTCANLLLARIGGPAALTAFWRAVGDDVSRLDHNEPLLNRSPPGDPHDTTSPAAMAGNMRRFLLGDVLSVASRRRLTDWMLGCQTGFNRLREGFPKNWKVADKTGNNGSDAAGDLAVVWPGPIVAAVYVQGGKPSDKQIEDLFAAAARLIAVKV